MTTYAGTRFLYLHLPKTGGVSFRRVLEDSFRVDEILHVGRPEEFGLYRPADLARYRFIHGHFTVGQVRHVEDCVKIVTLRDPIRRCLSTYDFWRSVDPTLPHWSPYARKQILAAHELPLAALCGHPDPEISGSFNNLQTWMMSGEINLKVAVSPALLQRALQNLAQMDFIALAEHLEASTLLLCHRFGLFFPDRLEPLNVSRHRTPLSDELRALLTHHNQIDLELIRHLEEEGVARLARVA